MANKFNTKRKVGGLTTSYELKDHMTTTTATGTITDPHPQYLLKSELTVDGSATDVALTAHLTDTNAHPGLFVKVDNIVNADTDIPIGDYTGYYIGVGYMAEVKSAIAILSSTASGSTTTPNDSNPLKPIFAASSHSHVATDVSNFTTAVTTIGNSQYSLLTHTHDDRYAFAQHIHEEYALQLSKLELLEQPTVYSLIAKNDAGDEYVLTMSEITEIIQNYDPIFIYDLANSDPVTITLPNPTTEELDEGKSIKIIKRQSGVLIISYTNGANTHQLSITGNTIVPLVAVGGNWVATIS